MKKNIIILSFLFILFSMSMTAQKGTPSERYGKALNLGLGIGGYYGYYGYVGHTMPVLHADYELDVARNFTLAPSISFYTYRTDYYWGNKNYPYQYYYHWETVIPIGVKGTYYFDQLFKINSKWDIYAAGSLGFAIVNSGWERGYYGDKDYFRSASPLFADVHTGAEYHLNKKLGLYLDLSTGVSTFGIVIH